MDGSRPAIFLLLRIVIAAGALACAVSVGSSRTGSIMIDIGKMNAGVPPVGVGIKPLPRPHAHL